jgi:translation initiation factor 6
LIQILNFFGNPNIGVYSYTNDKFCLIPRKIQASNKELILETLKVPIYQTHISNSRIIGILVSGNSHGLLLPQIINQTEVEFIEKIINDLALEMRVQILTSEYTALGNNILINDKAAIINPDYNVNMIKMIEDICSVDEVIQKRVASSKLVGSNALVTNKGLLVNPIAKVEELDFLENFFGVQVDIGTVNRGIGYVGSSGLLANSYGAIIGTETTGPEMQRIGNVLDV